MIAIKSYDYNGYIQYRRYIKNKFNVWHLNVQGEWIAPQWDGSLR